MALELRVLFAVFKLVDWQKQKQDKQKKSMQQTEGDVALQNTEYLLSGPLEEKFAPSLTWHQLICLYFSVCLFFKKVASMLHK